MSILRISRPDDDQIVNSLGGVEKIIGSSMPGRYHVDEISADPLPSGHKSRRWGVEIKRDDRTVVIERTLGMHDRIAGGVISGDC
jgi:hypothetical protein